MIKQKFKQMTIAAGVALAFGAPVTAFAITGVHFDPDGGNAPGIINIVEKFDWGAGHVLYEGCFGAAVVNVGTCTIYAQGSISAVVLSSGANLVLPANVGYTFTLVKAATPTAGGTYDGFTATNTSVTFDNVPGGPAAGDLFTIYRTGTGASATTGNTNLVPTPLTGAGYVGAAADIILQGSVTITGFSVSNTGTATEDLDQSGANNFPGVSTLATSGSPKFSIDVLTVNSAFFTDPIAPFFLSFTPDAVDTDNSSSPFGNTDPSKSVAGQAFTGAATAGAGVGTGSFIGGKSTAGQAVDDIFCGTKGIIEACSAEFQGDALTSFKTDVAPAPGVLALLGIGLAGLGTFARKRRGVRA